MNKQAITDHPVHDLISLRWSPYGYSGRGVDPQDLRSLFEAARWAPSSYNEQPWGYIVARKEDSAAFERVLHCLVEGNQGWARHAPVLALGLAHSNFARNGHPNRHAFHDLGSATANLTVEAVARGMRVHQMAGILPDRAQEVFSLPADWEAVTGIALGYAGESGESALGERDAKPSARKPLREFVFGNTFGETADWV